MQKSQVNREPVAIAVSIEVVAPWRNASRVWATSTFHDEFASAAAAFQLTRQQAAVSQRDTLVDLVMRQHRQLVVTDPSLT